MNKLLTLTLLVAIPSITLAQNCDDIRNNTSYFSASAGGMTEQEARINALTLLAENISSVVSSRTDMLTKDDGTPGAQKFYNSSKSTSVLHLKGVRYQVCQRNKKTGFSTLAFISRKDLEQSSAEVSARVQQYLSLMEQKEASGLDFLPEAYIAYLNTFMSPYALEYNSDTRHISNVRGYLESFLRTYLSNINVTCTSVRENPDYPDQQLTLSLSLSGTNGTRMGFRMDLPEYGARGYFHHADNPMDTIMAPDSRKTKFSGTLSLAPPPLEADLKDISDQVQIGRDLSFDADMSDIITLDFTTRVAGNDVLLTPVTRHLSIRQFEWLSGGRLLSTEQKPRVPAGLKEITMRINGSHELIATKYFDSPSTRSTREDSLRRFAYTSPLPSIDIERLQSFGTSTADMHDVLNNTSFAEDAIVFFQSDIPNLVFRSSMSAIDRQIYNASASRYEVLVKPVKQLLFVEAGGSTEKAMGMVNPQPKDAIYFRATAIPAETLISKGLISIMSDPPNASIFINDIETVYRTPFTVMVADGITKISLRKKYYQPKDTVIRIDGGHAVDLMMSLRRVPGYTREDALTYMRGARERTYYQETDVDPVVQAAQQRQSDYNRKAMMYKRRAAVYYSTAVLGVAVGAYYHWIDRLLYDKYSTSHSSIMSTMGNASYIMGGTALVVGVINSAKLSHLKKNWEVTPIPVAGGGGLSVTYKFK